MSRASEQLKIVDFLSIKKFDWGIKSFNIITGDMGSGKSLCIKLLMFFEDIIPGLLILPYEQFLANLDYDTFMAKSEKEFRNIFYLGQKGSKGRKIFNIEYRFSYEEQSVEINIKNDDANNIHIDSSFLRGLLNNWKEHLEAKNHITPDGFREVKLFFHNELLKQFGDHFPIATTFIPASRAALAFGSDISDDYLKNYKNLVDILPRFQSRNLGSIHSILKAKIKIDKSALWLESDDGRRVPISKASSGQQEIVYVLMLLDRLGNFGYSYGKGQSLFIEEPSAHLFPLEQKQTIELITQVFNSLKEKDNPVRVFITTHSPYILNSMNNILKKGILIEKYGRKADEINAA
ncbi:MAG: ATP-binding protein, partial [Spirochaetaceae bacterium]|nr:ATP-binding protein [Spirochaetaceae bacterium]